MILRLEFAFARAKAFSGPVIVHAITEKGHGYRPCRTLTTRTVFMVWASLTRTRVNRSAPSSPSWTSVFSDELVKAGAVDESIVAITAAMLARQASMLLS